MRLKKIKAEKVEKLLSFSKDFKSVTKISPNSWRKADDLLLSNI